MVVKIDVGDFAAMAMEVDIADFSGHDDGSKHWLLSGHGDAS